MTIDRTVAIVGGSAITTLVIASLLVLRPWGAGDPFADCRNTVISGGAGAIGGPFTLYDETGKTVTDSDVITGPTLVYFGYTFCPDVCPVHMTRTAEAVQELEDQGIIVTPVMISVDPERDTPERLAEWTDYLHPRMLGLSGTPEQIKDVAKAYKAQYSLPADRSSSDYTVDHITLTYLMMPGHGFVELFSGNESSASMAAKTACFVKAA